MLEESNSRLNKTPTWIILAVIIFFGSAAYYSSIEILQKEARAVSSYKQKIAKIDQIERVFEQLQSKIILYFDSNKPDGVELENISNLLFKLQNDLIYFNANQQKTAPGQTAYINDLQSSIVQLIPHIRQGADGGSNRLPRDVLDVISSIQVKLDEFANYQIRAEESFLSEEVFNERRRKIFFSVSLLSASLMFLIIFLIRKNDQLQRVQEQREEIYEISQQRIMAIEASRDGIGILDTERRLIYMNGALRELHGIRKEDVHQYIGKDWKELYNDTGKAHIAGNIYPVLDVVGEWRGESLVKRKDGKVISAEMSLSLLPEGRGVIGTARDITERRKAEQENKELQKQIYQAQKMEAVGRLAGGLAHDFNNILAAILGYAEFLSEDLGKDKDKNKKKFADNILIAGQKARALIDQMLQFSRRKEHEKSIVDLHAALQETVTMVTASLTKSIELNVDIHHEKPAYINGDIPQISQALMNIMVNAVDALEDERGEITVSLSLVEPDEDTFEGMMSDNFPPDTKMPPINIQKISPGHTTLELGSLKRGQSYFQISISDTGVGMSEAILEHIFEPFFTTKPIDKGTGLGMANVHSAIIAHQGAIVIDSTLMEGTTFDLFFPQASYIDDLTLINMKEKEAKNKNILNAHILVIDDQPEVLEMIKTLLTREGFQCTALEKSTEALAILKEDPYRFDLVITDQNMPKMTGVELIEQIVPYNAELPFIIISGYSHAKLQEIKHRYPAIKATIHKPARKELVLGAIENALQKTM